MMLEVLGLLGGFVALYFGAEWLVTGATRIALAMRVSKALVGLTLVAFGTSAPELIVNVIAGAQGRTSLALANVSGSNLANLCLGFGIAAFVARPFPVSWSSFGRDLTIFAATPALVVALLAVGGWNTVPLWGGLVLGAVLALYLVMLRSRHAGVPDVGDEGDGKNGLPLLILGGALLYVGGKLVVTQGLVIGAALGLSDAVLGLTVVAVGTSIPDIMATIVAGRRGETDLAIGNIVGSNIFNVVFVLPATMVAARAELVSEEWTALDFGVGFVLTVLFVATVALRHRLPRPVAGSLVAAYLVYVAARVFSVVG
jgi:cation:H+ antiporter